MDPAGELRANVTSGANGDMSCTVAETNRIRAALGLRPLRPGKPAAAVEVARPAVVHAANGSVRERVKKAREARLARRGAMGAVSIAERARAGEDDDDSDDDVEGWVARMRKRGIEGGKAQRAVEGGVTETHEKEYGEADLVGMQVAHAPGVLKEGEQMVFTLADTDVLAADESGEGVADLLENAHARDAEKTQRNVQRRKGAVAAAAYDATDTKEFEVKIGAQGGRLASDEGSGDDTRAVGSFRIGSEAAKAAEKARAESLEEKRRAEVREKLRVSAEVAEDPEFETDYMTKDEFEAAYGKQRAKMSNLFTRNGRRGKKKRRRRTRDADDEEAVKSEARPLPDTESKPVSRGHMQTIRDAAALEFSADYGDDGQRGASDENEEEEEEKALYASLARARKKAKDAHAQTSVQRIVDAMKNATERSSGEDSDNDGPLGEAAQLVYDEMEQFVRNIPTAVSDDEDDDDEDDDEEEGEGEGEGEEDDTMLVEPKDEEEKLGQETAVEQKREEGGSQGADAIAPVEGDEAMGYKRNDSEAETDGTRPSESAAKRTTPLAATLGLPNDIEDQAPMGIAAALARFRSRGELKHKTRQEGRAHDKRYDWNQATTGTGSTAPSGQREIKIVYTDEYGRELTQKEAFRVLCHKFHGKGPGKNKREKRLRQHLESLKVRNMASDDTPLASAAALKAETRETGRAHVVLSGSAAILRAPSKTVLAKQTTAPPKSAAPAREKDHVAKKQSKGHVLPSDAPPESAKRAREDDKVAFSFGTAPAASKRTRR